MSEAMWDDDMARPRASSSADVGAMARRPSVLPSGGAGPLPDKSPIMVNDDPLPAGARGGGDDFEDLESAAGPTAEASDAMSGDAEAGRTGLWAQGAPPAYSAPVELPPAYSERDPHPERVPWWKRAKRSFGRGLRKVAGFLGLGSLLGGGR